MKNYLKIIRKCPLFFQIEDADLQRMLNCMGARVVSFDKKYTVMAEDSPAKYIGIVLSGTVQLSRTDFYGNRSMIGTASAGEIFGEAFACAEVGSLPISVIAAEECEVMFVDASHILHTCENNCVFHRQLIFNLMKDLATKNIGSFRKLEITGKRTTREKLLAYLSMCAERSASTSFDIPFDRQELADYLEVDRSGLSAEIGKLTKEGVILTKKKHFELL